MQKSFLIQIGCTRSDIWQGSIIWTETQKPQPFHSAREMIKLMEDELEKQKKPTTGARALRPPTCM